MRVILFAFVMLSCAHAHAAEIVLVVPEDKLDWVLSEVFQRFHANSDRGPVSGKSDSEKLAYCFDRVIEMLSYLGHKPVTLEQMGAEVEVRR